jgi:golgi-specific brefeldin A-resistance guanine nucleotide exchange factor 1
MQLLAATLTHTRFEASNTSADEVVFLRVLKLMEGMISGPGGDLLSDESMCQIMETALRLCCEARITQLLQRSAEMSMVSMCQVVFERLKHLEIEAGDEPGALEEDTKDDMDTVTMQPSVNGGAELDETVDANTNGDPKSMSTERLSLPEVDEKAAEELNSSSVDLSSNDAEEPSIKPYSLPSIKELFRTLVELLDPHDLHYTDTMRVMALRIVDVALEVAGPSIANHPSLASLAKDTLCRHLFQLVRSENMAILNESLRVAGTLLTTCRSVLKLQQELFLSYTIACLFPKVDIPQEPGIDPRLYEGVPQSPSLVKPAPSQQGGGSGRATPVPVKDRQRLGLEGGLRKPDAREAMVESVGALVRMPSFMAELFVNYDCDIDRSDLCSDMVGLMSRNAFPDSATWSTTNVPPLCLDALLGYVQSIADRLDDEPVTEGLPDVEMLRKQRTLKVTIIRGASKFNDNPKAGIAFLASQGVIKNPDDPKQIADFVKGTSRIDKKILGEFLSKKQNESILSAFMNTFDFTGQRVDEALRQLLHTFRLPGESQLIERIVTEFAGKYCANGNPEGIADKDAVYVLTYAIIMLNTDQHNPNLKSNKRMAVEDFARNLRGVNGGQDFAPEYLGDIFDAIKTREIILPEEHNNKHAYDHAWTELLVKVQSEPDLILCSTNVFDADMFAATWRPVVATLSYVFVSASDDAVFQRVIAGFDQCAQIAAKYGLSSCLDQIIYCLSSISTLAPDVPPNTSLNTEVQVNDKSVMVSETAVRFGRDDRAQLATVVLFRVLAENEATVRDGWDHIVHIMLNLFINSLIPSNFSAIQHAFEVPAIPLQSPAQVINQNERQNEGGLFSALSSYVSSFANDEPPEPSEQEIENTLCAVDCIKACAIEEIFARMSQLPTEALRSVLDSLLMHLPEDSSPRVIVVKPEMPQSPARPHPRRLNAPVYDPKLVFVLELATLLAIRDDSTVRELGKDVADALHSVIRSASSVHYVVISRVVYYLLNLLKASEVWLPSCSLFTIQLTIARTTTSSKCLSYSIPSPPSSKTFSTNPPFLYSKACTSVSRTAPACDPKCRHPPTSGPYSANSTASPKPQRSSFAS